MVLQDIAVSPWAFARGLPRLENLKQDREDIDGDADLGPATKPYLPIVVSGW